MAPPTRKNSKPIFKTAIPFTRTSWPDLNTTDRENIMDLLCNLLEPVGDYRRSHIHPSRGKKRKRKSTAKLQPSNQESEPLAQDASMQDAPPPPPELSSFLLIGLNSVTRHLEALAAQAAPPSLPVGQTTKGEETSKTEEPAKTKESTQPNESTKPTTPPPGRLILLLIPHNHPPASLPHAHIPTLLHLSTLSDPKTATTRLIPVPPSSETRLASALHIPHVGALGLLEGAPGADVLVQYVREHVEVTRAVWVDEAMKAEWKGVSIDEGKG